MMNPEIIPCPKATSYFDHFLVSKENKGEDVCISSIDIYLRQDSKIKIAVYDEDETHTLYYNVLSYDEFREFLINMLKSKKN